MSDEADALHESLFVANLHDDWSLEVLRMRMAGNRRSLDDLYGRKMLAGKVDFSFYTVGGDDVTFTYDRDLLKGTLRSIDAALEEIAESEIFALCTSPVDIVRANSEGKIGLMLTIEGAGPLDEDLSVLRNMHRLGLRSVIITWFKANAAADGVGESRNGGLTRFGRDVIAEMGRLGMLVDISQSAPRTAEDIFENATGPVIASHSNCAGLYPHRRNITDSQLKAIALSGGAVGITAFPAHVGDQPSLEGFLDHVEYAISVAGEDHVSLGLNIVVHGDESAKEFYERSDIEYSDFALSGLEDLHRFPAITGGLLRRGLDHSTIGKVMGLNVLRVIELAGSARQS